MSELSKDHLASVELGRVERALSSLRNRIGAVVTAATLSLSAVACDDSDNEQDTIADMGDGDGDAGETPPSDLPEENGDGDGDSGDGDGEPGDGDGDGDENPETSGDGDGDNTESGDGDGDGDGDGETTGDGDGDGESTGDGDGEPIFTENPEIMMGSLNLGCEWNDCLANGIGDENPNYNGPYYLSIPVKNIADANGIQVNITKKDPNAPGSDPAVHFIQVTAGNENQVTIEAEYHTSSLSQTHQIQIIATNNMGVVQVTTDKDFL